MADEVIKNTILVTPKLSDVKPFQRALAQLSQSAINMGVRAALANFNAVGQKYEAAVNQACKNPVSVEGLLMQDITAGDVAQALGGENVEGGLSAVYNAMMAAGFATNKPQDFIRAATRNVFREREGEQPSIMQLNVPLERAAKAAREQSALNKASNSAKALQGRIAELQARILDPNTPDDVKLQLLRQIANTEVSLGRQSFVDKGVFTQEEAIDAVQSAASIRAGIVTARQQQKEDAKYSAYVNAPTPYSMTEALFIANQAQAFAAATPLKMRRAVGALGSPSMDATTRLAMQRFYNNQASGNYWQYRFQDSVAALTAPSDSLTRAMHAEWAAEQDAIGRSEEDYWRVKRRNAVNNIITEHSQDPEVRKATQNFYKAMEENAKATKSLTKFLEKEVGGSTLGGWITNVGLGYAGGKIVGNTVADFMEGRTSWLSDMRNPYDTKRNVMQQWGKKYGAMAGAGAGALIGTMILPGIGTAIGAGIGAAGATIWAQHNMDQKKIADELAKYSGNINIMRALYGNNIGYNAANAVENANLGTASDVLSLNATSAMLPGMMMFGAMSEQQMVGMTYLPNYFRALLNRENPMDILAAYRHDAERVNPLAAPFVTSMAGLPEGLRGLAMSDNFNELYAHKNEFAGMDMNQFETAVANSTDAIKRATISQRQLNTQFIEQSRSTRGNGTGEYEGLPWWADWSEASKKIVTQTLGGNTKLLGDLNVFIDGTQVASQPLKVEDWTGNQTIYATGGQ